MTQEEKELLLKDLYARLPYSVMVRVEVNDVFIKPTDEVATVNTINMFDCPQKFKITPYLRPMSSMTNDEMVEFDKIKETPGYIPDKSGISLLIPSYVDWLNAHHFDYRGLIEKGLALEAPEDMYKK